MTFKKLGLASSQALMLAVVSVWSAIAHGNMTLKLDLESKIREKTVALVAPVDPSAQVSVSIKLKKLSMELPGTGAQKAEMDSSSTPYSLSLDDIEKIDINVVSKLNPFPESLKKNLEQSLSIPTHKRNITYQVMTPETISLIQNGKMEEGAPEKTFAPKNSVFLAFGIALIGILLSSMLVTLYGHWSSKKHQHKQIKVLEEFGQSIKEIAGSGGLGSGQVTHQAAKDDRRTEIHQSGAQDNTSDQNFIRSLTTESLTSLLSDCYWCENDEYAKWIWTHLNAEQREKVCQFWSHAREYAKYFAHQSAKSETHHHHPYYLKPIAINTVSNQDLKTWLNKSPENWNALSPMRQSAMDLSLAERISFGNRRETSENIFLLPTSTKAKREFSQHLNLSQFNEADEAAILNGQVEIPDNLKPQVLSLVWFALLPIDERTEIVKNLNAQQIAEIWIGPENIVKTLIDVVPSKKLLLAEDYRKRITGNRSSSTMKWLVAESIKRLKTRNEINPSERHAA